MIGCGPVGLAVIAGLKLQDVHPIIAADFSPARRALALRMGADIVVDPAASSPYASWQQAATPDGYDPSRYARLFDIGPKQRPAVIFECVGVPGVIQQVMDGAPAGARIVVVGVCMQTDQFEPFFGIVKQLNLQFVLAYTAEEFAASLHHIAEGVIDVTPLITGQVGLARREGRLRRAGEPGATRQGAGRPVAIAAAWHAGPAEAAAPERPRVMPGLVPAIQARRVTGTAPASPERREVSACQRAGISS